MITRPQIEAAYARSLDHLCSVQRSNGAFAGEVIWNPMLVCQYVIVCHILGQEISGERRRRIRLGLERQVRPDGGWGMHPQSPSWLFHTALGYIALRLLDHDERDPLVERSLAWIRAHDGVYAMPAWGRIWLAMLGLYPWSSVQPILPELWLLPDVSPGHPRRLYCHMRLIYMGLSHLYGLRFIAANHPKLQAIRAELYPEGYEEARFESWTGRVAPTDLFEAPPTGVKAAFAVMRQLERILPGSVRRRALERTLEHMLFELRSTNGVCLSPVNGFLFCLALHAERPDHPELPKALRGMEYWTWEDDVDGLRFCGARSDIWDTSFVLQAVSEGPALPQAETLARSACRWLEQAQMQADIVGGARHYRESATGGWGFANEHHPWPVSDCTAEAMEALLRCAQVRLSDATGQLPFGRTLAALEFILIRQNDDGGFGSYEPRRGNMLLRHFNPAEIYGNCMLEYSYTECTGSCMRALAYALEAFDERIDAGLRQRMRQAIDRAKRFILSQQQRDSGGWLGFWGINLTYGTFFATHGLLASGVARDDLAISRAVDALLQTQRADGGWGESWQGMAVERALPLADSEPSLAVQTAWALLTLLEAAPQARAAIDRGAAYLLSLQQPNGAWPREDSSGCFFNTAVLEYELYRQYFPAWVLARYLRVYRA